MFERSLVRESAEEDMDAGDSTIHSNNAYHSGLGDDEDLDSGHESEEDEEGSGNEETDESDGVVSGIDSDDESEGSSYTDDNTSSEGSDSEADEDEENGLDDVDVIRNRAGRPSRIASAVSETGSSNSANGSVKPKQSRNTVGTLTRRLLAEKGLVISTWKEILGSFADFDLSTSGGIEAGDSGSDDLPALPQDWAMELIAQPAGIDLKTLLKSLKVLHGSMSKIFSDLRVPNAPTRRAKRSRSEYNSLRRAREKALMRVAKEHVANPSDFDEQVQNLLKSSPDLIRLKSRSHAMESAQAKVSKEIIEQLGSDSEKAALAEAERLANEILALATPRRGFPACRAEHYALLEIASAVVGQCDFEDRVETDTRVWTAKSDWLATHVNEATEASKRSVASEILDAISEQELPVIKAKLNQTSQRHLKQWKADTLRPVSDAQITSKWSRSRRDALMVVAAEHVSDVKKHRNELSSQGEAIAKKDARRAQEYRIAIKVIDNLEVDVRDNCLLRAEALAIALTDAYIEDKKWRPGRGSFLESIVPFSMVHEQNDEQTKTDEDTGTDDDHDSTVSSHHDASEDEVVSRNGEDIIEEDDAEMPAPKRFKMDTSGALASE